MKPGPAISAVATPSRSAVASDLLGHLAGVAPERLGERQRAVGLGVGPVRRAHHGVDAGTAGDGVERRLEAGGEDVEGISHRNRSLWRVSTVRRNVERRSGGATVVSGRGDR